MLWRIRAYCLQLHRWAGLVMTVFLVVVGLTGCLLAFYSEIDCLFNPGLYPPQRPHLQRLDIDELAQRAVALAPQAQVTSVYLREPERAEVRVEPRHANEFPGFDTLLLDPYTGNELARYQWGDIGAGKINLMPFIYRLHYELASGSLGLWLLGSVALLWTINCFVGFALTLPAHRQVARNSREHVETGFWRRWSVAWRIKWRGGRYRLTYDLHRAVSLWLWAMLLIFAWSGVYMNLGDTVYAPVMRLLTDYRQEEPSFLPVAKSIFPPSESSWPMALERGRALMQELRSLQGVETIREVSLSWLPEQGVWRYRTQTNRDVMQRRGMTDLYFDIYDGSHYVLHLPTGLRFGNTVTAWLFALHVADVWGMPWRIVVSILGLVMCMLAITGLLIWWRKRSARIVSSGRAARRR